MFQIRKMDGSKSTGIIIKIIGVKSNSDDMYIFWTKELVEQMAE